MAKKQSEYNEASITVLKGEERVRQRLGVMLGSEDLNACQHAVFEIVSNATDEAREGFGDKIVVTSFEDLSIEVQDFGRGIPVDYNERERCYNWKLLFCEMYAGGKYNNSKEKSAYGYSSGFNGLGLNAVQASSEWMEAEIHTRGYKYTLNFKAGKPVGKMGKEEYPLEDTGTRIRWKPDLRCFTEIDIPAEYFKKMLNEQAFINAGIRFVFRKQKGDIFETEEYYYENGLQEYFEKTYASQCLVSPQYWTHETRCKDRDVPGQVQDTSYMMKADVIFSFSDKISEKMCFHNSSFLENGGSTDRAIKSAFLAQIDAYLKNNGKYVKTDPKITIKDVEDSLVIIFSSFSTYTSYENQTKKAINNKGIQDAVTAFLKHQLEIYFLENPADAERITTQILINMRSRVKAEKTRIGTKESLKKTVTGLSNRVEKFVDCRSKNVSERELFIVEGDSAKGACVQSRNAEFQAVMPVRGKILNCIKEEYSKIFESKIVTDLIKVIGCGVEIHGKGKGGKALGEFSMDALRWNKVIICTDADVDGFHIRTLILGMIYRLMPELIRQGKVFIAESPLYEIQSGSETWFAYDEKEKADVLSKIGKKKYTIQRSKGLGENDPEMMSITTMSPETRRLIQVSMDDAAKSDEMFNLLLGKKLESRKDYIQKNGYKFIDTTDSDGFGDFD